jgi:bacteriocin biosynthesis cyclodehydratase domain-containing protein
VGVVGPLVLPGRSACLRCLDLARAERDPAWPLILAQLASPDSGAGAGTCDAVLATAVAALATAQALTFVDTGRPAAAVSDATLELAVPDWQWRRRSWPPHPRCSCGAAYQRPRTAGSTAGPTGPAGPDPRASPQHRSMTDN